MSSPVVFGFFNFLAIREINRNHLVSLDFLNFVPNAGQKGISERAGLTLKACAESHIF